MTRKELFERYVADTLDEAAASELDRLLKEDAEFAAGFARDLLNTGKFEQAGSELRRIPEKPVAHKPHPHLVTGAEAGRMPRSLQPPKQGASDTASGLAAGDERLKIPKQAPQPVLKSAQRRTPVAAIVVAVVLVVGITVALLLGLSKEPPAPEPIPVIARIHRSGDELLLRRESRTKKIGKGTDLLPGDRLIVRSGEARVAYVEERTYLQLHPGSELVLDGDAARKTVDLELGRLAAEIAPQEAGRPMKLRTRHATVMVPAGRLTLHAQPALTEIHVLEGKAAVNRESDGATLRLEEGSCTLVRAEGPLKAWQFHSAVNLNGPAVEIGGRKWLSHSDAQYKGLRVEGLEGEVTQKRSQQQPAGYLPDPDLAAVLTTGVTVKGGRLVMAWPLPNDHYQVFVWILEDKGEKDREEGMRSLRLNLEEKLVAEALGEDQMQGDWTRFGPFPAHVEDESLDFLVSPGPGFPLRDPHLMGFAVYKPQGPGRPAPREEAPE